MKNDNELAFLVNCGWPLVKDFKKQYGGRSWHETKLSVAIAFCNINELH